MPRIPDFIQKEMDERVDHPAEMYAARRIFKALGIGGAAIKRIKAIYYARTRERLTTDWDAAINTLQFATGYNGTMPLHRRFAAVSVRGKAHALEVLRQMDPVDRHDHRLVLFARVDPVVKTYSYWRKEDFPEMLQPPYTILESDWPERYVVVEQLGERFLNQFGPYVDAVNELMREH
jgi:hypothetical protein